MHFWAGRAQQVLSGCYELKTLEGPQHAPGKDKVFSWETQLGDTQMQACVQAGCNAQHSCQQPTSALVLQLVLQLPIC